MPWLALSRSPFPHIHLKVNSPIRRPSKLPTRARLVSLGDASRVAPLQLEEPPIQAAGKAKGAWPVGGGLMVLIHESVRAVWRKGGGQKQTKFLAGISVQPARLRRSPNPVPLAPFYATQQVPLGPGQSKAKQRAATAASPTRSFVSREEPERPDQAAREQLRSSGHTGAPSRVPVRANPEGRGGCPQPGTELHLGQSLGHKDGLCHSRSLGLMAPRMNRTE